MEGTARFCVGGHEVTLPKGVLCIFPWLAKLFTLDMTKGTEEANFKQELDEDLLLYLLEEDVPIRFIKTVGTVHKWWPIVTTDDQKMAVEFLKYGPGHIHASPNTVKMAHCKRCDAEVNWGDSLPVVGPIIRLHKWELIHGNTCCTLCGQKQGCSKEPIMCIPCVHQWRPFTLFIGD